MTRDPVNGQYAYNGNYDRLCTCGHTLGAHLMYGMDCGTNPQDYPETKNCQCTKFKPSKRKQKP